jgi:hypothetical protein
MMQIPEFGVSGAEMYGTKPLNIDLPVELLAPPTATDGSAEEIADLKAPYTPQIGTFCGMRPLCGFSGVLVSKAVVPSIIEMKEFVHAAGVENLLHLKRYKGCECVPRNGVEKMEAKS